MKEIYADIVRINALDPATPELRFCKLSEEHGEFAQAVNKKLGRKVVKESEEDVIGQICEEAADTIQCLFSYIDSLSVFDEDEPGSTFKDVVFIPSKIILYDFKPELELMNLSCEMGLLAEYFLEKEKESFDFEAYTLIRVNEIICSVISICGFYDIKPNRVLNEIIVKNVKWEKVAKKRK